MSLLLIVRRHQSGLAEVILLLQILHFCFIWTVDDADGDGEDSVALGLFFDSLVDHVVVKDCFFASSEHHVLQTSIFLLQIDVTQATVEEHLARIKLELKSELIVVYPSISTQVQECIVEVCQCFFEVAEKEVADALLEVGDCKILVQLDGPLIAFDGSLMLAQRGMDYSEVEKDLRCIGYALEAFESVVKLVVVVCSQRCYPRLDLLFKRHLASSTEILLRERSLVAFLVVPCKCVSFQKVALGISFCAL